MNFDEICKATEAALSQRDSRRNVLAGKIREIAHCAMRAADADELCGDSWTIERRTATATCSQWADGSYARTGREDYTALVLRDEIRSLGPAPDCSFFDGNNMQHQQHAACDGDYTIRPATVAQLRAVARELPELVAELLAATTARAEREAIEADAALAEVAS